MAKAIKIETREFYTRSLARPNRRGQTEIAQSRKIVTWTLICDDGRRVEGFTTKRQALAHAHPKMA